MARIDNHYFSGQKVVKCINELGPVLLINLHVSIALERSNL